MGARGSESFFRYARARHQITLDRAAGKPRPWTKDPILQNYRFTCVFRELDKTTKWFADNVRNPMRDKPEVLLATVVFRLLNRIEVGEAVFCQTDMLIDKKRTAWDAFVIDGNVKHLKNAIIHYCGSRGPYVTGAYIISSPPGYTKLDGVLEVIRRFYHERHDYPTEMGANKGWHEVAESMRDTVTRGNWRLEDTWRWLSQFDYFGGFHSYEIVTDLRHTVLLDSAPDIMTWANIGPGARRGATRVLSNGKWRKGDPKASDEEVHACMADLLSLSRDARMWSQAWQTWEMRDVEHTLCEFDKYQRVLTGEGTPRGVYR